VDGEARKAKLSASEKKKGFRDIREWFGKKKKKKKENSSGDRRGSLDRNKKRKNAIGGRHKTRQLSGKGGGVSGALDRTK